MAQRRIVFFPLPEPGHIFPTLEIARHYVAEGCEVTYLTSPQFTRIINSVGARIEPIFRAPDENAWVSGQQLWYFFCSEPSAGARRRKIEQVLQSFVANYACDLLLLDHHLVTSFQCDIPAALGALPTIYLAITILAWDEPNLHLLVRPTLTVCPKCFEVAEYRDRGEFVHYVEPSVYRHRGEPAPGALRPMSGDTRPLILAVWGTQSIRYSGLRRVQSLIMSVARRHPELRFVMAMAQSPEDLSVTEGVLANMQIATTISQLELMKSASVVITHGGLNSLKEAIFEQVPSIVIPFITDQPFNALRIERCGAGVALFPEEQTAERLEAALLHCLSGAQTADITHLHQEFVAAEADKPSHAIIDRYIR